MCQVTTLLGALDEQDRCDLCDCVHHSKEGLASWGGRELDGIVPASNVPAAASADIEDLDAKRARLRREMLAARMQALAVSETCACSELLFSGSPVQRVRRRSKAGHQCSSAHKCLRAQLGAVFTAHSLPRRYLKPPKRKPKIKLKVANLINMVYDCFEKKLAADRLDDANKVQLRPTIMFSGIPWRSSQLCPGTAAMPGRVLPRLLASEVRPALPG